jgi:hypothetical protein
MFSTHDYTTTTTNVERPEAWADVKAPGNGRIYAVGTIAVEEATNLSTFSFQAISLPPGFFGFTGASPLRQIVVLQCSQDAGSIQWQRHLFGASPNMEGQPVAHTNARGISVWAADTEADTRIAICGETYEQSLPLSQLGSSLPLSLLHPTGFVAVYDGFGALLWTHQFYGTAAGSVTADCAITDVSIRVEDRGGTATDVVTYCGISSHGLLSNGSPLEPVRPFAVSPYQICGSPADGSASNGTAQWDGIVGRVSRDHANAGSTSHEFHSIVGGTAQDGLFGIAELDASRFVVVGATADPVSASTSTSFPLTLSCLDGYQDYCIAVAAIFDASAVPSGSLVLESSTVIGTVSSSARTMARDVAVGFDSDQQKRWIHIVGATDDGNLRSSTLITPTGTPFQASLGGGIDGFVLTADDDPTVPTLSVVNASWYGTDDDESLSGVASWSEFSDHFAFAGYRITSGNKDILVGSVFIDTTAVAPTPPFGNFNQILLRESWAVGSGNEEPAVMGARNATLTSYGLLYDTMGLGSPSGGGLAVDHRFRLNAVGATVSTDYPVSGTPFPAGLAFLSGIDAVRTEFDMLPQGVSRTDGTGTDASNSPVSVAGGADGGTTPVCARLPFGEQIGMGIPDVKRMLIDYEGPVPAFGATPSVLLDRPHWDSLILASVIDVGFPLSTPISINQLEIWLNPGSATTYFLPIWDRSVRWPLISLPASPFTFTVQMVMLLNGSFSCGGPALYSVASPALTIDY